MSGFDVIHSIRRLAWMGSIVAITAACSTVVVPSQLPIGPAAGDMQLSPFYRFANALPAKPGILLREEPMPAHPALSAAGEARRLLYTSTDVRWQSGQVPVSGTLYLPTGAAPAGGWPLLAWAHGTLGIADACAPSWTGFRERDASYINRWLQAGFAVVITDYQGLGGPGPHPYLNWQAEGRSVLDAARAAMAARPGQIAHRILIAGQSQGSGAALGAARLAREYAPELQIVGAVMTGLNSTFPTGPISVPVRNSPNMFLSFAAGGLRDDGPAIDEIVNDKGRQLLAAARSACTAEVTQLARKLRIRDLAEVFAVPMERVEALRIPVTDMPMEPLGIPLFVGTGLADATITPMRQYAAVSALCASGNAVSWKRYEGHGHDGALHGSFDDSLALAREWMAGKGAAGHSNTGNCATITQPGPPGQRREDLPFNDD